MSMTASVRKVGSLGCELLKSVTWARLRAGSKNIKTWKAIIAAFDALMLGPQHRLLMVWRLCSLCTAKLYTQLLATERPILPIRVLAVRSNR